MSDNDESLWAYVTRSVKKMAPQTPPVRPMAKPVPSKETKPSNKSFDYSSSNKATKSDPPAHPHSIFDESGIDRATYRKLKRGELSIDRKLDLHGLDQTKAHEALNRFIAHAWDNNARMLLIITGQGRGMASDPIISRVRREGVLRGALPGWLNAPPNRDKVLKLMPAAPKDGGAGAFYVMLKRKR